MAKTTKGFSKNGNVFIIKYNKRGDCYGYQIVQL